MCKSFSQWFINRGKTRIGKVRYFIKNIYSVLSMKTTSRFCRKDNSTATCQDQCKPQFTSVQQQFYILKNTNIIYHSNWDKAIWCTQRVPTSSTHRIVNTSINIRTKTIITYMNVFLLNMKKELIVYCLEN